LFIKGEDLVRKFRSVVFKACDIFNVLACICIFLSMMVVVVHVAGRVFFRSPIFGLVDIVGFAFGLSCVFAFCVTEKNNGHVKLDFFMERLAPTGKKILHVILGVMYLGMIAIIAHQFYRYTATTFNNRTVTWIIRLPLYPVVFLTAVGFTLYFLTALVNFLSFFETSEKEDAI